MDRAGEQALRWERIKFVAVRRDRPESETGARNERRLGSVLLVCRGLGRRGRQIGRGRGSGFGQYPMVNGE